MEMRFKPSMAMGTIPWGMQREGELASREKIRLVGNLLFVRARDFADKAIFGLGLSKPTEIKLDDVVPQRSALVEDCLALAEETHESALLLHSWRTYLYGTAFAAHEKLPYDRSLFFAAAILHDIGLTAGHEPNLCKCCFAVSGGQRIERFLRSKGHPEAVAAKVGNDIALHLNGWVSKRLHGTEAHLVSRGAVCDLFGAGRRRVAATTLAQIEIDFPRDGVVEALQFGTANHRKGSRPAVMTALSGGKAPG